MPPASFLTSHLIATAAMLALGLAPSGLTPGPVREIRDTLRNDLLNRADYERMERGYYEQILDAGRQLGSPTGRLNGTAGAGGSHVEPPPFIAGPRAIEVPDLREFVLKPNLTMLHDRARWTTNSRGMRDRSYSTAKPPHTLRIALVGDSIGAGWGVADEDGFEPTLERTLDARSRAAGGPNIEILNFAVPGHGPGQRWDHFTKVGWETEPDLVLYEATLADAGWDERRLRGLLPRGVGWDTPWYRETLARSGAPPGGTMETYKRLLKPYRWDFTTEVYRYVAADCRARGVPCIWFLIPRVGKVADRQEQKRLIELARQSGFTSVLDLSDVFDGFDQDGLAISREDYHPNAKGHARIARRLDEALQKDSGIARLGITSVAGGDRR